jgi:hypothetical protein
MDTIIASTQYTDMRCTAAADVADGKTLQDHLRELGHLAEDEYVIGVSFYNQQGRHLFAR